MEFAPRTLHTPRGELTLRRVQPADAERFRDLRLLALQTSPVAFGMAYEEQLDLPLEDWRLRLARPGITAVIDNGTEFVGMAGLAPSQGMKVRHKATIWGVFVRPAWRGMGLAGEILAALLDVARREPGIQKVDLSVVTTNTKAQRLYERLGFRIYGTSPAELFVNGVYYDEHLMVLMIRS